MDARVTKPFEALMARKPASLLAFRRFPGSLGTFWNGQMACPEGLEPPTPSLEGWCSIQLSYGQPAAGFYAGG